MSSQPELLAVGRNRELDMLMAPAEAACLAFRVTCVPPTTTHQAKRIVRVGKFARLADKPELVAAKAMLDGLLLPFQPPEPVTSAVRLTLVVEWPWRASEPKRTRAKGRARHTSKPDADNIAKAITDRLVALRFLEDDNAVAELIVQKWWSDTPGISIRIERVS